jgi:hypothetical protein
MARCSGRCRSGRARTCRRRWTRMVGSGSPAGALTELAPSMPTVRRLAGPSTAASCRPCGLAVGTMPGRSSRLPGCVGCLRPWRPPCRAGSLRSIAGLPSFLPGTRASSMTRHSSEKTGTCCGASPPTRRRLLVSMSRSAEKSSAWPSLRDSGARLPLRQSNGSVGLRALPPASGQGREPAGYGRGLERRPRRLKAGLRRRTGPGSRCRRRPVRR